MRVRQTTRQTLATFLSAILVCVFAGAGQKQDSFIFTKVDLDLLEQCNLLDKRLEKEGLVYVDQSLASYLERVGRSILPKGDSPEKVSWQFRILRDPLANAIALPNGSIYVNTGLLALMDNEAQLASVLAHEVTHVVNRHTYLTVRSIRKKTMAVNIFQATSVWNPVGGAVGLSVYMISATAPLLLVNTIYGYSRELEKEADIYAVDRLVEAGYDPRESVKVFELLLKDFEGDRPVKLFYNDHPQLEERIAYVSRFIQKSAAKNDVAVADKARYLAAVEKGARHNIQLDIDNARFRTAVALSQKLMDFDSKSSENLYYLAESYRSLGPRAARLTDAELTSKAKKDARKKKQKMTLEEEESELMDTDAGQANWKENQQKAQDLYFEALELDGSNPKPHRGLGMLFEKIQKPERAILEYRKYLELAPSANDRLRIIHRIEALEKAPH